MRPPGGPVAAVANAAAAGAPRRARSAGGLLPELLPQLLRRAGRGLLKGLLLVLLPQLLRRAGRGLLKGLLLELQLQLPRRAGRGLLESLPLRLTGRGRLECMATQLLSRAG